MKEKKIDYALKSLNVHELNAFRKFLTSPYFNQNETFVHYFDFLNEKIRKGEDIYELTNYEIWEHLFKNTEYEDVKFRKIVSAFFKLFDEFITQEEIKSNPFDTLNPKLRAYNTKLLAELYPTINSNLENLKKIQTDKSAEFYLQSYNIQKSVLKFKSEGNLFDRKLDLTKELNLDEISLFLDVFYIAEKLKYYCAFLSWKRSFNLEQKIAGIDFIIKLAKTDLFKDYPPIAIYYTISLTLTDPANVQHYFKLKQLIEDHIHFFHKTEAKEIFEAAISYTVTKGNKGLNEFEKETFELYKKAITDEILTIDEKITTTTFRNIVASGLKNSELNWVENFILDYAKYLPEDQRETNVNFSLARLEGYRKNWRKLIGYLINVEYKEVFQALLSRTLLVLAYYELKEYDSLDSLLLSFKQYLDREKSLTKQRKMPYYHLITFTRKLTKLKPKAKDKIAGLKEEIEATEGVVNKAWLLEKLNELG